MAGGGSDNLRNLPIRMYVAAILDGDPEIGLLYESVCDHNDSENQAVQRSVSTPIVPEQTQVPKPSEVERKGKEIAVCEEPIEHSDERDISSQNDTAKVTPDDSDDDMSRTISDVPTGLGNVSRCPNDESVNNNENNAPVDDANSGKKVNRIKEKKGVLLTQIMKNIERSKNKSDKPSVPKVNSGKRGDSKARRTIDVEDEDDDDDITLISSRKRKANKIDLNKKPKEANVKMPRLDEVETSKLRAARRKPGVVLALPSKKQKVVPADEPRPVVAKPLIRDYNSDDIERLFAARKVAKGLRSRSVHDRVGDMEKNKAVQVEDTRLDAARRLSGEPKDLKSHAEKNDSFRKVEKAVCLGNGEMEVHKPNKPVFYGLLHGSGPSGSVVVQPGEAIKKNSV